FTHDPEDDFPQFALAVGERVAAEPERRGILLCRSGGGMTIVAKKVPGVRAVQAYSPQQIKHDRTNDDVNVMTLAGDWGSPDDQRELVRTFIETPFSTAERHQRRLDQIAKYERASKLVH